MTTPCRTPLRAASPLTRVTHERIIEAGVPALPAAVPPRRPRSCRPLDAEEEQRVAAEAARKPLPAPSEPPDWGLERSPLHGHPPLMLHTGACWRPERPVEALTRDQAVWALVEQNLPACVLCRPDTALGVCWSDRLSAAWTHDRCADSRAPAVPERRPAGHRARGDPRPRTR